MERFPLGLIVLIVVSLLIFFGVAQRALDRMRLSDKGALVVILALIVGSFVDIPIPGMPVPLEINLGGALVPVGLAVYLLAKAGTGKEVARALIAAALTALVIWFVGTRLMSGLPEPAGRFGFLDTLYLYPIVAALIAYIAGRSRRSAFIGATLGVLLADMANYFYLVRNNATNALKSIGGAGAFDSIVISGILAILLADLIGETRERLQGGPASAGKPDALLAGLRKPEFGRPARDDKHRDKTNDTARRESARKEVDRLED
ncbi:DUF1614 domain-containing protein [Desulforamulus hydrothermalis]|uniref:DUF1614 domain-containing protein n=1 Tax=Desulforamulus hydrothermalis Lam5 = DSM 18033 TaxID=1121428 RepID=K8E0L1_9FIRM|nr:DUF1614 domain-containing protein [Desulforamulus hydrothermalis]CCO09020.1 conserved membrane hypothetical protein [Desulforamulus hydrothermalis Lam5 = DSM 18033]SHG77100.1 Uncharacterized membrane protein [Desulforamulus hydrothermalis Lam5 = DSM 18033]